MKGKTRELSFPARLRLIPSSMRAMARNVGDLAILEATLKIDLSAFEWTPPRHLKDRVAKEISVDVYLMLNTISPDKSGDPRDDPDLYGKHLRQDRIRLRALGKVLLRATTRTVKTDYRQRPSPEVLHYSVVDELVAIEAGEL